MRRAPHARRLGDVARSTGDAHARASSMRQSIGLGMNVGDLDDARIRHAKWRARGTLAPCISRCPQSWALASGGRPTRVACPPSSRCRRHNESASRSRALRVRRRASDERGGGRRRLTSAVLDSYVPPDPKRRNYRTFWRKAALDAAPAPSRGVTHTRRPAQCSMALCLTNNAVYARSRGAHP